MAKRYSVTRLKVTGARFSSYSDALVDLADGDQIHAANACTLYTVTGVEHRDGGLVTGTIAEQAFEEPAAPPQRKKSRKATVSRNQRGVAQGSIRYADGSVRPAVDRRSSEAGDMGGIAGFGCLD